MDELSPYIKSDDDTEEQTLASAEYAEAYSALHTISSAYRDIFVDCYLGGASVKALAEKYGLPVSTVKWRLNVSREENKKRIGENSMDRVYKRINMNTTTCNGSMD